MEDSDVRFHSGIPVGHKFLAILLALAVAGAGCAWLIYRSGRSSSAAVLAFNPTQAQQIDPGISSAKTPAVALADTMLSDQAVAQLAKQGHLASSTPAGQIGEFRSSLHLSEASPHRLRVRFMDADASQSMSIANAVAHALTAWTPAPAGASIPPAPAQSPAPSAAPATQPVPSVQGQSHPAASPSPSPEAAAASTPPDHPLSQALTKIDAQLSSTNLQLDRIGPSSYTESSQQSLLRNQVHAAQRTLSSLQRRYPHEATDPGIHARLNEIHQALGSILPTGLYAVGVSTSELLNERSELRQAIRIVDRESKGVQAEEAAHPAWNPQPAASNPAHTPDTTAAPPAPQSSSQSAPPAAQPTPAPSSTPAVQEQSIPPGAASAPPQSTQTPWTVVHLAGPAPRPPLWPAFVAGALCGLLYLGIAAIACRRGSADDIYPDLRSTPQRMITPDAPAPIAESPEPEPSYAKSGPRQRAAFVFEPSQPEEPASAKNPPVSAEPRPPSN